MDAFRIIPKLLVMTYMAVFMYTIHWFTELEEPTPEQTTFIGILTGVGTAWFGIYVNTKRKKEE